MTDRGPLNAVSPLDGRYAAYTEPLVPYASERALMRARLEVEVEYLLGLADMPAVPLDVGGDHRTALRSLYERFDDADAQLVKELETEGHGPYAATNHDVKAIEYFLRLRRPDDLEADQWFHFGLTSEDVNNLAYRIMLSRATAEVLVPALRGVRDELAELAREYRNLAMLSHTHGQPATPTTFGKEMAVYASRLGRSLGRIDSAAENLAGKLAGASGTYAAHTAALPDVDWPAFARNFVSSLGLEHEPLVTQVNPSDDVAALLDAYRGANNVLVDLDRDAWLYVSWRYLGQDATAGETGSSTMPHKINPIDFENAEGNLTRANADLTFLADAVTTSRLQRDLSDSTLKRNYGSALGHCLIGYEKTCDGIEGVVPNEAVMAEDLATHPEVIGEAVQTILRREGHSDAYERVKELSRGREVTIADFRELFDELDVPEAVRSELSQLAPSGYTGLAADLVDELD